MSEARARHSDPTTSHEAAAKVDHISEQKGAICRLYEAWGPMIDEELQDRYAALVEAGQAPKATAQSVRSRRSDLVKKHRVVTPTGDKKKNSLGNDCEVYALMRSAPIESQPGQLFDLGKPGASRSYGNEEGW